MTIDLSALLDWVKKSDNEIYVNLFSGLLSGAIVLSLQSFAYASSFLIYDFLLGRLRTKRLFGFPASNTAIHILSGSLQNKAAVLMGPDAKATAFINFKLESIFKNRLVMHTFTGKQSFAQIPQTDLVSIGGPVHNLCTRELFEDIKKLAYFDSQDRLIIPQLNLTLAGSDSKETTGEDYGVVIRIPNPASPRHKAIVIAGCGSHAVYAGSLVFTDSGRFPNLKSEFRSARGKISTLQNRDFLAVVRCKFRSGEIHNVHIDHVINIKKDDLPS